MQFASRFSQFLRYERKILYDWNSHPLTLLTKENKNIIISKKGSINFMGNTKISG
jgi:hypothetical protein